MANCCSYIKITTDLKYINATGNISTSINRGIAKEKKKRNMAEGRSVAKHG